MCRDHPHLVRSVKLSNFLSFAKSHLFLSCSLVIMCLTITWFSACFKHPVFWNYLPSSSHFAGRSWVEINLDGQEQPSNHQSPGLPLAGCCWNTDKSQASFISTWTERLPCNKKTKPLLQKLDQSLQPSGGPFNSQMRQRFSCRDTMTKGTSECCTNC